MRLNFDLKRKGQTDNQPNVWFKKIFQLCVALMTVAVLLAQDHLDQESSVQDLGKTRQRLQE
ncbi:MAG: hypothetical protein LBH03_02020 [Holophagales bacterium]|nr:hypothetical protein [Holophagales bacterium]